MIKIWKITRDEMLRYHKIWATQVLVHPHLKKGGSRLLPENQLNHNNWSSYVTKAQIGLWLWLGEAFNLLPHRCYFSKETFIVFVRFMIRPRWSAAADEVLQIFHWWQKLWNVFNQLCIYFISHHHHPPPPPPSIIHHAQLVNNLWPREPEPPAVAWSLKRKHTGSLSPA